MVQVDIMCPVCAEPVDNDELHEVVREGRWRSYAEAAREFRRRGCEALGGNHTPSGIGSFRAYAAAAMFDINGDDMDGAASMLDDFDALGLI